MIKFLLTIIIILSMNIFTLFGKVLDNTNITIGVYKYDDEKFILDIKETPIIYQNNTGWRVLTIKNVRTLFTINTNNYKIINTKTLVNAKANLINKERVNVYGQWLSRWNYRIDWTINNIFNPIFNKKFSTNDSIYLENSTLSILHENIINTCLYQTYTNEYYEIRTNEMTFDNLKDSDGIRLKDYLVSKKHEQPLFTKEEQGIWIKKGKWYESFWIREGDNILVIGNSRINTNIYKTRFKEEMKTVKVENVEKSQLLSIENFYQVYFDDKNKINEFKSDYKYNLEISEDNNEYTEYQGINVSKAKVGILRVYKQYSYVTNYIDTNIIVTNDLADFEDIKENYFKLINVEDLEKYYD
uniref:hypothetical protein n=1 Tax=Brachyspira catarrhinii TaxID=2528966 RepID=UPI003F4C90A7